MKKTKIESKEVIFFANPLGSNKDKFNRTVKLALQYDKLLRKFDRFSDTNSISVRSICAVACTVMAKTGIRIGNEKSAEGYVSRREGVGELQTFGLTTLKKQHVKVRAGVVTFRFTGKRGIEQIVKVEDARLAKKVKELIQELEGDDLFPISEYHLRTFVRTYVGKAFTPKDFRTLRANIEGYEYFKKHLKRRRKPETKRELNSELRELVTHVSEVLGNTPAMAKRAYIDPRLLVFVEKQR